MNVPLIMVDVPKHVPTRMDPLCAAVDLDSPWPVMDEAAMVSWLIDIYTGCVWRGRKEGLGVEEGNEEGKEERVRGERRGQRMGDGWEEGSMEEPLASFSQYM